MAKTTKKPTKSSRYARRSPGDLIADARKRAGLSQTELAMKAGRAPNRVCAIEHSPNVQYSTLLDLLEHAGYTLVLSPIPSR